MAVEKRETIVNDDLLDAGLLSMPGLRVNGEVRYKRMPNGKVVPVVHEEEQLPERQPEQRTSRHTDTTERTNDHNKHRDGKYAEPDYDDAEYDQLSFDGSGWTDNAKTKSTIDKLRKCAKSTTIFGGMSMLFFYWQQTGQMAQSAAYPAIVVCALLVGWGIGRNIR